MARVDQHLAQWKHNRKFATTIDSNFRDWQVTAVFYTALHLVDAVLVHLGVSVYDHTSRNQQIRTNAVFAPVRQQYLDLYRISRVVRYDADPAAWIPASYLTVNDLANDLLKPIENTLGSLLGKSFKPLKLSE